MKATTSNNKIVIGKTLKDIRSQLIATMKNDDLRAITAVTTTGATVHVSLYDGQDYIRLANGRILK